MSTTAALGVSLAALNAWAALSDALDRLADDGRKPVCATRPDQWSADARPNARADAAEACTFCPVLHPCAAYADAADERHGVWGGTDRTKTATRKKRADAA